MSFDTRRELASTSGMFIVNLGQRSRDHRCGGYTARGPRHQAASELELKVPHLSTERRLGGVKPVLRRDGEAISIDRHPWRVRVLLSGIVIADTRKALALREAKYPIIYYIPRADVDLTLLTRSEHTTYCPFRRLQLL